jgi:hypothetical protein
MKSCLKTLPLIALVGLSLLAGCGKDDSTGPANPTTVQGWIDLAWSQYESGNYLTAGQSFGEGYQDAQDDSLEAYQDSAYASQIGDSLGVAQAVARLVAARDQLVQILSGGGWVNTKLGMPETGNANFVWAIGMNPSFIEALGGHAFSLQASGELYWVQSNEMVVATLALDPTWTFTHEPQINYLDLLLVKTENYYSLGDFQASLDDALALNAIVNFDPSLGPEDFNLATIEGRAALADLINNLDDLI